MLPLLSASAMQAADRETIEKWGLDGFTLMESAGRAAAQQLMFDFDPKSVGICCGKGNNGGDGLVMARVLQARGIASTLILVGDFERSTPEVSRNLALIHMLNAQLPEAERITILAFSGDFSAFARIRAEVWVDALLGTGLQSEVRGAYRAMVDWLNAQPEPVVAIDVPSGLDATTGKQRGTAVRAWTTYTMGAEKIGLRLADGRTHAGAIRVLEMGIPMAILQKVAADFQDCGWMPTLPELRSWIPARSADAQKYEAGYLGVLAGSVGMTGAAILAGTAAERSGAGGVIVCTPASAQPALSLQTVTLMTRALPETTSGGLAPEGQSVWAEAIEKVRALLIGPGLGQNPETAAWVRSRLAETVLPLVLDADGLNALADDPAVLYAGTPKNWVLTPHWGEFKRLADTPVDAENRLQHARDFARKWCCVVALKGFPGLIAAPDGRVFLNTTGNPAAATAGTGDVLAGSIAAWMAQGLDPLRAAVLGYHVAGRAADEYIQTHPPHSMTAADLWKTMPIALQTILESH